MTEVETPQAPVEAGSGERRGRRGWLAAAAATLTFVVGLGVGVALPPDAADLEAARAEIQSSADTVAGLQSELAEAENRSADLADSLTEAEDRVSSSMEEAEAALDRVDARQAKLDKRQRSLEKREQAVADRENALADLDALASTPTDRAPSGGDFDRAYAIDIATDIVEDIESVDERLGDGIMVSSALSLLSDSYGRLLDAGFPPGIDESEYYGRVTTLQSFAEQAADTYDHNPSEGSARYAVIREQTGILFQSLNAALGTQLRLS